MTAKQIAGYLKARRDQAKSTFGGISFNDGYNVPTYGITQADYYAIDRSMNDEYGMMASSNLTTAGVKKALRNHPISAKGPSVHHAPKKSPAQLQREIDEALTRAPGRTSRRSKLPERYEIVETIDGDWMILIDGIQTGSKRDRSGAGSDTYPTHAAAHEAALDLAQDRGGRAVP